MKARLPKTRAGTGACIGQAQGPAPTGRLRIAKRRVTISHFSQFAFRLSPFSLRYFFSIPKSEFRTPNS
jgi:hypothetical protein